jgi:hypothetical protein
MARLNSTLINAVERKVLQSYELVYIDDIGGENVTITNAPFDITYLGYRYLAIGSLLNFTEIREETQFTISEMTITVSGLPSWDNQDRSIMADLLEYDYIDHEVNVYRAFFDADTYLDSVQIFNGRISNPIINDDPNNTTTIGIIVSNNWIDYERTNGMITNNNRQIDLYPGDLAFQYTKDVIKDIQWQSP